MSLISKVNQDVTIWPRECSVIRSKLFHCLITVKAVIIQEILRYAARVSGDALIGDYTRNTRRSNYMH